MPGFLKFNAVTFAVAILAAVTWQSSMNAKAAGDEIVTYSVKANYDDVMFDLTEALTNKGLVVNFKAHVANMLNRTAKDVGATRNVYRHGMVLEFCSAKLSRAAMEADPRNMAFCPYTMFIYETVAKPGHVTVGYRRLTGGTSPASKKALAAVNKVLESMVREAAGLE